MGGGGARGLDPNGASVGVGGSTLSIPAKFLCDQGRRRTYARSQITLAQSETRSLSPAAGLITTTTPARISSHPSRSSV